MGDCVESLAEVKVDNIHGSPFVYPASHVIVESYQIGQRGRRTSLDLLTTLLLMHPRIPLAFWATGSHWCRLWGHPVVARRCRQSTLQELFSSCIFLPLPLD